MHAFCFFGILDFPALYLTLKFPVSLLLGSIVWCSNTPHWSTYAVAILVWCTYESLEYWWLAHAIFGKFPLRIFRCSFLSFFFVFSWLLLSIHHACLCFSGVWTFEPFTCASFKVSHDCFWLLPNLSFLSTILFDPNLYYILQSYSLVHNCCFCCEWVAFLWMECLLTSDNSIILNISAAK